MLIRLLFGLFAANEGERPSMNSGERDRLVSGRRWASQAENLLFVPQKHAAIRRSTTERTGIF
ncbi:hypothetical protein AGR6A_pAt50003 [Agrobacterium sp. NCPPB 925]|nr:hypothetical protein AGR6A_pAt50003 [Agrobacterium sp. NCPPB 925]